MFDIDVMYVEWAKLDYVDFEGASFLDVRNSDLSLDPTTAAVFDTIAFSIDLAGARTFSLASNVTVNTVTVAGMDASNHATLTLPGGADITNKINLNGFTTLQNSADMSAPTLIYLSNSDNDITNNANCHLRFSTLELENDSICTNNGIIEVLGDTITLKSNSTIQGIGSFLDTDIDNNLTVYSGGSYVSQSADPTYFHSVEFKSGASVTHLKNTTAEAYRLYFICSGDFIIEDGVTIDLSGKGYRYQEGPGAGLEAQKWTGRPYSYGTRNYYRGGGGAAYGGDGSNAYTYSGTSYGSGGDRYGSLSNPMNIGSGGGNGIWTHKDYSRYAYYENRIYYGGYGGGAFIANVAGKFTLNGSIKVNGASATTYYSSLSGGGGAGGTINITAGEFESTNPSSVLEANGGNRYSAKYGGGGSGGRIAVKSATTYSFSGTTTAYGGDGYYKYAAPGTIYIKTADDENLYVKNASTADREKTYMDESGLFLGSGVIDIESADIQITESVSVNTLAVLDSQVNVNTASDITVDVVTVETTTTREASLNCNSVTGQATIGTATLDGYNTSYHARLYLPETGYIDTVNLNGNTSLYNYGTISTLNMDNLGSTDNDVYNYSTGTIGFPILTIGNGSLFYNAGQYLIEDDNFNIASGGEFRSQTADPMSFDNVYVYNGGTITQLSCSASQEYKIHLVCSGDFTLEQGATINANYAGYPNTYGPGAGVSTSGSSYGATGGSYGGKGGDGYHVYADCDGYGSITDPTDVGSGGGDNTYSSTSRGGYGGGAVILEVAGTASINGNIYANGESAYNSGSSHNGGGGSGGTINIEATTLTLGSTSTLQARGGNRVSSSYRGGGGGGGRIALRSANTITLSGTIQYYGGDGYGYSTNNMNGGAGTLYIKEDSVERLYIQGTTKNRDVTIVDDLLEPMNLSLLSTSYANVEVNALTDCDELQIVNTDLMMSPESSLTIDTVDITLDSGALDHRRCTFEAQVDLADVTVQGYSSSRHAELELINGADITSSLQTNGYTTLYNYTTINLPTTYTMLNTDNDIYNYLTGNIILPVFTISSGSYVQDFGVISPVDTNLTINSGGTYEIAKSSSLSYTDVVVGGTLTHTQNTGNNYKIGITCNNNFTINTGGTIDASARGYLSAQGPGAGESQSVSSTSYGGCGASYAGWGSNAFSNLDNTTNQPYGSVKNPVDYGSGGGSNTTYGSLGGSGGGIIDLNVVGTLTVDGTIISNGSNGQQYAGGGSGGSIRLITDILTGSGSIQSNGGSRYSTSTNYRSGGGSGGRIAVYTTTSNLFTESQYIASGGEGYYLYGAAGTVYINNNSVESLYVRNSQVTGRN